MMQEFAQQAEETARAVLDEIHTAMPGMVLSFDPADGTAMVKPQGKFVTADGKQLEYPQIVDVPVIFPLCQTAEIGITYPVKRGDSCLIIISEAELDEWRSGAEPEGPLRFDLTSAVCIPGMIRKGDLNNYRSDAIVLSAGSTSMVVSKSGITIRGNLKVDGNIQSTGTIAG